MTRKNRKNVTKEIYNIVISLFQQGFTIKTIADSVQLCSKTVGKLINEFEAGREFITSSERRVMTCRLRNNTYSADEQSMFNQISCNNALTQNEIKSRTNELHGIQLSQSTISRKLKKMKITRKRLSLIPEERNTVERLDARAVYASEVLRFSLENLIVLDETGFNQHTRRKYGYSPVNQKAFINVPANKNINKSLMCAIGFNGILAYEYKSRAYNTDSFCSFIREKLIPYFVKNPNHILIMDNASFHKSATVLDLLRNNNIVYKFITPYSPELNPIEEFFSMLKSKFCTVRSSDSSLTIERTLDLILGSNELFGSECQGFFNNMVKWLEKARRREHFI